MKLLVKPGQLVRFAVLLAYDLLVSALRVARSVFLPLDRMKPGVIAVPTSLKTDLEIMILANSITLTPGTLTLDVSEDKKTLYVHTIYIGDPEEFRRNVASGIERLTAELMK